MVFVFYYAATHSLEMTKWGMFFAGVFTVGQLSFWGNYLPRVYPDALARHRRRVCRQHRRPHARHRLRVRDDAAGEPRAGRHAIGAAGVGGDDRRRHSSTPPALICSFFLPEPEGESTSGIRCLWCYGA